MKFGVSSAWVVGECSKCRQPTTGEFISDEYQFELKCVSCSHVDTYILDELGDHSVDIEIDNGE